jgi:hypothetical protein
VIDMTSTIELQCRLKSYLSRNISWNVQCKHILKFLLFKHSIHYFLCSTLDNCTTLSLRSLFDVKTAISDSIKKKKKDPLQTTCLSGSSVQLATCRTTSDMRPCLKEINKIQYSNIMLKCMAQSTVYGKLQLSFQDT